MFEAAKAAQKTWARTPLYKRAEALHRVAQLMRENAQPIADCLVSFGVQAEGAAGLEVGSRGLRIAHGWLAQGCRGSPEASWVRAGQAEVELSWEGGSHHASRMLALRAASTR